MPFHGIPARSRTAVAMAVCGLLISLQFRACSARSLQRQHPDHCSHRIFWFMAITSRSSMEYWHYAKVAVLSAKEKSPNLIPVLLYGGSSGLPSPAAEANLQWYREAGGIVYPHNLTFMSELQAVADMGLRSAEWPQEVEGTYLRMDVPHIVPHLLTWLEGQRPGVTEHVNKDLALYTDADVLFYHEFDPCSLEVPEVMAIGPEMDRSASSWSEMNWNAGVLLINLKGFAAILPDMLHWANGRHWNFQVADQSMLNEFFPGVYGKPLDPLPAPYNWKGYWGCSPEIVIIHWHGPKPERCLKCYIGLEQDLKANRNMITECKCPGGYNALWHMAMDADGTGLYKKLVRDHDKYASMIPEDHVLLGSY